MNNVKFPTTLPILIEENTFIYPSTISPIFINDEASINALSRAQEENNIIFITTSRDASVEDGSHSDFYDVGVIGNVMRRVSLPNGKVKFLFQGVSRGKILKIENENPLTGEISLIIPDPHDPIKLSATLSLLYERIDVMSKLLPYFPSDLLKTIESYDPNRVVDTILSA